MARRRIEAGELIVEIPNTPDFEVENYGQFHQGICRISNGKSVECTVFFTTDAHMEGLWSSHLVSCNSFLKVYGFGRENASVFAVMEKVSRNMNIVQFFQDRNLKKHQANMLASAYDDTVTFLVKDEVKWLKANPTGNQKKATSELRALFCHLLDINESNDEPKEERNDERNEERSFLNFLVRKSSYYHPFLLTEIERERFSYRLEEPITNIKNNLYGVKLYWLDNVQKYPLQAGILKDKVYSDDLFSMAEFLRNFYKCANDKKVIAEEDSDSDSDAAMPTLKEKNTSMRELFGDDYLSCLWKKFPSDAFDHFNFGRLI